MNSLSDTSPLRNQYFGLRHGQSEANLMNTIISDPVEGANAYGLTDLGRKQVENSISNQHLLSDRNTVIYSSDFARTRETAEIAAEVLGVKEINYSELLRERGFGRWERKGRASYPRVWLSDALSPGHTRNDVESVHRVLDRTTRLIADLEKKYEGKNILLVSHGDVLHILSTAFTKRPSRLHRSLIWPFGNGELRKLSPGV
jgi:probable phosphoglycerate mutase